MDEVSEFIYQIFGAVLFCAGVTLMIVHMNSRNENISYEDAYRTVITVESGTDGIGAGSSFEWSKDDIIACAASRSIGKMRIGSDVFTTDTGALSELLCILRHERYTAEYHTDADGRTAEIFFEPAE